MDLRKAAIERITPAGLQTVGAPGSQYEIDSIEFATGYDAMTGALLAIDLRGRGGERLARTWESGPRTYVGLMVAGFPNLFTITGPRSPSVLANMIFAIEQHIEWISRALPPIGVLVIEAGLLTPPFGVNVFATKSAAADIERKASMASIFYGPIPTWVLLLLISIVLIIWPQAATWLPRLLM